MAKTTDDRLLHTRTFWPHGNTVRWRQTVSGADLRDAVRKLAEAATVKENSCNRPIRSYSALTKS